MPPTFCAEASDFDGTVAIQEGTARGRCSLWWRHTPAYDNHRVGIIGQYFASDHIVAHSVLEQACARLAAQGCTLAVGPMDGNTWRQYRFVTDRGSEASFFLEPDNPAEWPGQFVDCGFEPLADYFSALNKNLGRLDPGLNRTIERLERLDVRIRTLDANRFEEDLRSIHTVATLAFRKNLLYSPMPLAQMIAQYSQLLAVVPSQFVLIAERQAEPVGFLFAVPDLLQGRRGERISTVVVKTLAVVPARRYAGLGNVMLTRLQRSAAELGYERAIYALVRDVGPLCRMSGRYARIIRRYTLYAKRLRR